MIGPNLLLKFTSFERLFLRIYCSETIFMINDPTHMIIFYIFVHIQTLLRFYWCMQFMIALKGFGRGDGGVSLVRHDLIQSKMEIFFRWLLNWPSSRVFRKAHPIINIG